MSQHLKCAVIDKKRNYVIGIFLDDKKNPINERSDLTFGIYLNGELVREQNVILSLSDLYVDAATKAGHVVPFVLGEVVNKHHDIVMNVGCDTDHENFIKIRHSLLCLE